MKPKEPSGRNGGATGGESVSYEPRNRGSEGPPPGPTHVTNQATRRQSTATAVRTATRRYCLAWWSTGEDWIGNTAAGRIGPPRRSSVVEARGVFAVGDLRPWLFPRKRRAR